MSSSQVQPNLATYDSYIIGAKGPIPLTTIFTPPPSCLSTVTYDGTTFWQNGLVQTGDQNCYPPSFTDIFNSLYTPGICPDRWTSVGKPPGPFTNDDNLPETRAFCCPSGYYLSSTNTGPLRYACASLFGSQLTNVYSTTTRAEGPIPKSPRLITVDPESVSNTVYADVIQVAYASTDRQILRLLSSASHSSSSSTARPGAVSRTQPAAAPATITNAGSSPSASSDDKGLSTGAKAGIGVAVPLGVIALFLIGYFIWYRRRQAKKDPERGAGEHRLRFSELDQAAEKRPPPAPVELDARETQELPGDGLRAEAEDDMAKRSMISSPTDTVATTLSPTSRQ